MGDERILHRIHFGIAISILLAFAFTQFTPAYADLQSQFAGALGTNNWDNPSNALGASDSVCAAAQQEDIVGFWKSFNFNIPAGATIDGIEVTLRAGQAENPGLWSVNIGKSETILGTPKDVTSPIITVPAACNQAVDVTLGSPIDTWDLTLSPSDVNSPDFTVKVVTGSGGGERVLNSIKVTVYFTPPPIQNLDESLALTDSVSTTIVTPPTATSSLEESLALTDSVDITVVPSPVVITNLSESISLTDSVSTTIVAPPTVTINLEESLGLTDSVSTIVTPTTTISLEESLSLTDSVITTTVTALTTTKNVEESLSLTDSVNITVVPSPPPATPLLLPALVGPGVGGGSGGGGGGGGGGGAGVDFLPPSISSIRQEPSADGCVTFPEEGLSIRISANVFDPVRPETPRSRGLIEEVTVRYITLGMPTTPFKEVEMSMVATDTWEATIPSQDVQLPGIVYWIHAMDRARNSIDTERFTIILRPVVAPNASIDLHVDNNVVAAGKKLTFTAEVTNVDKIPLYGKLKLLINGDEVAEVTSGIIDVTSSQKLALEWRPTRTIDTSKLYNAKIVADFYCFEFQSNTLTIGVFKPFIKKTVTEPLTEIDVLPAKARDPMTGVEKITANPNLLYTLMRLGVKVTDPSMVNLKLTAPDGTCVIGQEEQCWAKFSTVHDPGGRKTVSIGESSVRVKYTGPNSKFERFSISPAEKAGMLPEGIWKLEVVGADGQAFKVSYKLKFTGAQWLVGSNISVNTTSDTVTGTFNQSSLPVLAVAIPPPPAPAPSPAPLAVGRGGPDVIIDNREPWIVSYYWKPEIPNEGQDVTINANILDDVAVKLAVLFYYGPEEDFRKVHSVSMRKLNTEWFTTDIPSRDVNVPRINFWIVAVDADGNWFKSDTKTVEVHQTLSMPKAKETQMNLPAHVLEAIKPKPTQQVEKLEVISMNNGNEIKSFPDRIIIKNAGNITADNIRIILSPEIAKSFKLSNTTIKSIEPNGNVTISFELNGSPNKDMAGNLVGYKGKLIVMAEHITPIIMPVNIGMQESNYISNYLDKVASIAEQRYNKISLINSILSKHVKTQQNYEVTTLDGDKVITSPSDELVIRNLSDKELKNVRIYLSNAGNVFLLEQKNIQYLEPNGQVSIKLIPRIDTQKYSPKDIKGELLIVPSNDKPIQIPIDIVGAERMDSIDEFEVRTMSGNNTITTAVDKITIKNVADRRMESVKIILSNDLARIFSLSEGSFQHIEPSEAVVVEVKYNAGDLRTFMQDHTGELTVVSEHHNIRKIPISIEWKEISSEHFTVYARSGDELIGRQVVELLEANYQNVTSRFGEMKTRTVIYMAASMDEMRLINTSGHPYYSHTDDTILICACDDVQGNALKEFVYRLIINNYPSYYNMKKLIFDQENWLLDGISSYVAANIIGTDGIEKKYLNAFANSTATFQWYGYGSDAQYGATHTFLEFLESKYGNGVIDKTLYYLGSGMISNHRCSGLEDCAVLHAVYDASGFDMDNKRYYLDFDSIVEEWKKYIQEKYTINADS